MAKKPVDARRTPKPGFKPKKIKPVAKPKLVPQTPDSAWTAYVEGCHDEGPDSQPE